MRLNSVTVLPSLLIYILSIVLYVQPITDDDHLRLIRNPTPILDEMHLVPDKNADIDIRNPSWSLKEVFTNDYWGRPMNSPSSHKSYRPLTILSFRFGHYLATRIGWNYIFTQRILNIILHAAITQMIGRLSTCLCMDYKAGHMNVQIIEKTVTSALFMLHPTHIETVVNAANRAHLLGLLFAVASLDLGLNIFLTGLIHIAGLLSCETAIFFLPAIILTWVYLDYIQMSCLKRSILNILPRSILVTTISLSYLYMRQVLDWISIPDELIRPAENPFYSFQGVDRIMNYAFVLSVHLIKSLGMGLVDLVGFSHEYGFDCIEKITSWQDGRLLFPLAFIVLFSVWGVRSIITSIKQQKNKDCSDALLYLIFMAWMATLFPVSGVIKVGTFIADRIVIGSTVASCVFWGRVITRVIAGRGNDANADANADADANIKTSNRYGLGSTSVKFVKFAIFLQMTCFLWVKIQARSKEWMYVDIFLESSLRSCPRSAKSHLEVSKIHAGLVGGKDIHFWNQDHVVDLDVAKYHLELAEEIDPDYCDVHFQVAQLYVLQNKGNLDFEERLVKGILCPTTMYGAHSLFQQYWSQTLSGENPAARKRYQQHMNVIQEAIDNEKKKKEEEKSSEVTGDISSTTKEEF